MREAFAKLFPEDDAILTLSENNSDYRLEAIGARHELVKFNAGFKAGAEHAAERIKQLETALCEMVDLYDLCSDDVPAHEYEIIETYALEISRKALKDYK